MAERYLTTADVSMSKLLANSRKINRNIKEKYADPEADPRQARPAVRPKDVTNAQVTGATVSPPVAPTKTRGGGKGTKIAGGQSAPAAAPAGDLVKRPATPEAPDQPLEAGEAMGGEWKTGG